MDHLLFNGDDVLSLSAGLEFQVNSGLSSSFFTERRPFSSLKRYTGASTSTCVFSIPPVRIFPIWSYSMIQEDSGGTDQANC